jgi:hypothetical protein
MDASQLTNYRKAHNQFMYYEQLNKRGPQDQANIQTGAPSFFLNGRVLVQSGMPILTSTPTQTYNYSMNDSILQAFELFLQWIVTNGFGPTATARVLYMWFMAVAAPWNWVSTQNKLSGTHDIWNFDQHTLLSDPMKVFIWTNHAMVDTFATLFTGYDISSIIAQERSIFGWTIQQQQDTITNIRTEGNWPAFWAAWQTWAAYRNGDGSATYLTQQPTTSEVVNLDIQMNVYNAPTIPDYSDPHNPTKWTPLYNNITNKKQKYLTYYWDSVTSTGITPSQEVGMDNVCNQYYVVGQQRIDELNTVMEMTAQLNDVGKVMAEFWAGGPNTVTPPGMMGWFWKEYVSTNTVDTPTLIFSGLDVAIHLFEGSRITWRNKARKDQARPIQELRILHNGQMIASWNGNIPGETWIPYQEADFVTPPFADFPSGHSHFSQGLANTMTAWFGQNIPTKSITKSDLILLSPLFNGTGSQTNGLDTITISTGKSLIQPDVVPAASTSLSWVTWQDLANSAGMSRLYGGIHCLSAHTSSQAVANQLHTDLNSVWGFNRN